MQHLQARFRPLPPWRISH